MITVRVLHLKCDSILISFIVTIFLNEHIFFISKQGRNQSTTRKEQRKLKLLKVLEMPWTYGKLALKHLVGWLAHSTQVCFTLVNQRVILCLNLVCSNLYGGMRGGWSKTHTAVFHSLNFFFHLSLKLALWRLRFSHNAAMKKIVCWCRSNISGMFWKLKKKTRHTTLLWQLSSPDIYTRGVILSVSQSNKQHTLSWMSS